MRSKLTINTCLPFLACFSLRFFNVASAAGEADGPVMEASCVRN